MDDKIIGPSYTPSTENLCNGSLICTVADVILLSFITLVIFTT